MSSDKLTTAQRKGIHDRARTKGYHEGIRSGINQLTAYLPQEEIGRLTISVFGVVLDTYESDIPIRNRFEWVVWEDIGVSTLGDLHILTRDELAATQSNPNDGVIFAAAVIGALAVFNLKD